MDSAIIFDNTSCKIGHTTILAQITLRIDTGAITGILGQNGAGKSTLLSLITGLRNPSNGTITVLGEQLPMKGIKLRQRIGVVLQETALYEELTTSENLRFYASLYSIKNPKERIAEVLALLNLTDRSHQRVKTLSGGLRRRITIARSLLHKPELLIIDEPTVGVDVETRHIIWQHLRFLKTKGTTVVVATNYLDEAQALCDTVAVLQQGKLIARAAPETLVARAGYCLDIECKDTEIEKIKHALHKEKNTLRIETTPSGVAIFLENDYAKEQLMQTILKNSHIESLRMRTPDLAEIFKTLEEKL